MSEFLQQLNSEYFKLDAKYKNNYKVAEFYPTASSINTTDVGCVAPNAVKMQRVDDVLHTADSCKLAVSLIASNADTSASKTDGLQYTVKPSSGAEVSGISTDFTSIVSALGDKVPSQQIKYTVVWEGFLIPDVTGTWTLTISANSSAYLWRGTSVYNEFNATIRINGSNSTAVSKSTSFDVNKGEQIPIRIRFDHTNTTISPAFSFTLTSPSGSGSPLFVLKNADGTLYKPPQMYYGFVEYSPEYTTKGIFECHYATSLNDAVPYMPTDNTDGFYHSVEEHILWKLFQENEISLAKPGNAIKIDATGVHVFNAQNVIVKTLHTFDKSPLVRYVRVERNENKNEPLMLNINEIEIYDQNGKIPSDQMTAKVSPQYGNSNNFGAKYLIDGNTSSKTRGTYNLPHTISNMNSYMEVDILRARPITKVMIHNRNDCCKDRILRGQLVLLDEQRERICRIPITQVMNVYEFNISKDGCATSSSSAPISKEGTGVKYTLGLISDDKRVQFAIMRENPETGTPEMEMLLFDSIIPTAPSYKWKGERDSNKYTEYSDTISFTRPIISSDSRYKLMFDSTGNAVLYASRMGCQTNSSSGGVNYRSASNPAENQFIYGIQNNEKFNKTYYINKMDKTMQYLPRNNPMLANTSEYTPISDYVPSKKIRESAVDVATEDDCKKMCNDVSGCPWYSIFKSDNQNMCVVGTTQSPDIVSPDMMVPVKSVSGITSGAINIRNKEIPLNTKYMLGDNIPFTQIMESAKYAPYNSYQVNPSPIIGEKPIGLLSEKDVQDYFAKQKKVVGKPIVEGMTDSSGGIAIQPEQLSYINNMYLRPSLSAAGTYNNQTATMREKESNIRAKIADYERIHSTMSSNRKYRFHPDDIITFQEPPTLADGINDDNKEMRYQQNLIYATTGIAVVALGIAAAMIVSRS